MFLDKDERLLPLIMRVAPPNVASLKNFKEAGIKTVRLNAWASWHEMEPEPGKYYWDKVDEGIELVRKADLKVAVHLYRRAPDWLPDEGKIQLQYGNPGIWELGSGSDIIFFKDWLALNPFHTPSLQRELDFLERACEHFSVPGVVECSYAMPYSAERVLPFRMGKYTEKMAIDIVLARQEIFARYGEGLWSAFHPLLGTASSSVDSSTFPNVGNEHSRAIYATMHEHFPDHSLNRILYGFFAVAGEWDKRPLPHVKTWVGSEHATGVVEHAKMLNSVSTWGMVMACPPCFRDDASRQPTSQEFDWIAEAVEILNDGLSEAEEIHMSG